MKCHPEAIGSSASSGGTPCRPGAASRGPQEGLGGIPGEGEAILGRLERAIDSDGVEGSLGTGAAGEAQDQEDAGVKRRRPHRVLVVRQKVRELVGGGGGSLGERTLEKDT